MFLQYVLSASFRAPEAVCDMNKFCIFIALFGVVASQYGPFRSSFSSGGGSSGYSSGGSYGGRSSGYGGDSNSEPTRYEFKYDVLAPEFNVEFGHQEQRDGYSAQGSYYVTLPDGRRQLVEYTADQNGFQPRISYSDGGSNGYGREGYGGGSQGGGYGASGYSRGREGGY